MGIEANKLQLKGKTLIQEPKFAKMLLNFLKTKQKIRVYYQMYIFFMQIITSIPGKLLFLVYELYKNKKISLIDKGILKDLILGGSKDVMNAYQAYIKEGTELTLTTNLITILRNEKDNESLEKSSEQSYKVKQRIRARRNSMNVANIIIPVKNIQKIPNIQGRI